MSMNRGSPITAPSYPRVAIRDLYFGLKHSLIKIQILPILTNPPLLGRWCYGRAIHSGKFFFIRPFFLFHFKLAGWLCSGTSRDPEYSILFCSHFVRAFCCVLERVVVSHFGTPSHQHVLAFPFVLYSMFWSATW